LEYPFFAVKNVLPAARILFRSYKILVTQFRLKQDK
jgi:hypothetical protein